MVSMGLHALHIGDIIFTLRRILAFTWMRGGGANSGAGCSANDGATGIANRRAEGCTNCGTYQGIGCSLVIGFGNFAGHAV
jgi:hypothetical protein